LKKPLFLIFVKNDENKICAIYLLTRAIWRVIMTARCRLMRAELSIVAASWWFVKRKFAQNFDLPHPEIHAICTKPQCQEAKCTKI
jgi:hypothetical protein